MFLAKLMMTFVPASFLAAQLRKPSGLFGKYLLATALDKSNHKLHEFMKEQIQVKHSDYALEVGFGSGKIIHDLAKIIRQGKICGIDFSEEMVEKAKILNKHFIKIGKVELQLADVAKIPYPDDFFDKIYTANTIYFWSNPVLCLNELHRVLKKDGKLVVAFRVKEQIENLPFSKHGFTLYEKEDVEGLLNTTGFQSAKITLRKEADFDSYCGVAIK
ncbi:MAG: ubiquinone/menaquinone biosynthesis C-methylase UbiE [bacterium]|jgi:ubiquinone/menaquinone biosynthesis C-methylase UbiE